MPAKAELGVQEIVAMQVVYIELPWPPSVNTYWRRVGTKTIISKSGRLYLQSVQAAVLISGCRRNMLGELQMSILAYPPDMRRRDLDNVLKGVLDSLQKCGVYGDDFQIAKLSIERRRASKPGRLEISIQEIKSA